MDLRNRLQSIDLIATNAVSHGTIDLELQELVRLLCEGTDEELLGRRDAFARLGLDLVWHDPHA